MVRRDRSVSIRFFWGDPVPRAVHLACCWALLLGASTASAEPPPYERCLAPTAEAAGGTATLLVRALDRSGDLTESRAQVAWQTGDGASRVLLEMLEPAEISGSRVLLIEREDESPQAWAYLPEIAKVKRVGSRHLRKPLFGTTITYTDLERAGLLAEKGEVDGWVEASLSGRPVWRIEARAGRERITTWLDRERCVPLRIEVTDRKGRLARLVELSVEAFDPKAATYVPRQLLVRDVIDGSETRVTVEDFARGEIAKRFFDPERLAPITTHATAPTR
jgi:hypothetical protein